MQSKQIAEIIYRALEEKKGENIKILDISKITVIADYFIIATGDNDNQVRALADNVQEELLKQGIEPRNVEGYRGSVWVLLDYNDVVVHIFSREDRMFYDLERIWRDAPETDVNTLREEK